MSRISSILVIGLAAALAAGPARADEDHHGKPGKHDHDERGRGRVETHFDETQRVAVHGWYTKQIEAGHCPPGLAKKHNGCMPPGLAKKHYAIGQPLPPAVVVLPVPPTLVVRLGPPPYGYQYGMVDGDIVKLALGTALVVDAIQGLTQ
jgi:hypothetical protein